MIGKNEPVCGRHMEALRQTLGITVEDANWLFGISMSHWSRVVKQNPDEPIRDITIAIITRYLDKYYDRNFLPVFLEPAQLLPELEKIDPHITRKRFSIMVGKEASSGYRWIVNRGGASPAIRRAGYLIMNLLKEKGSIAEWEEMVEEEAAARGKVNIWTEGRWTEKRSRTA